MMLNITTIQGNIIKHLIKKVKSGSPLGPFWNVMEICVWVLTVIHQNLGNCTLFLTSTVKFLADSRSGTLYLQKGIIQRC